MATTRVGEPDMEGNENIVVWDCTNQAAIHWPKGHEKPVSRAEVSPDNSSGLVGEAHVVKIWTANTSEELGSIKGHTVRYSAI